MRNSVNRQELEYYLNLSYPVTVHKDPEGGFVAEIEELSGCMTQANTIDEVFQAIEDAKKVWIETAYNEGHDIPLPRDMEKYPGKFLVRIPKSLHRSLVNQAKREGVSLNQYVTTLLTAGVSSGVIGQQFNTNLLVEKIWALNLQLDIFGTTDRTIDYIKLLEMKQTVLEGNK